MVDDEVNYINHYDLSKEIVKPEIISQKLLDDFISTEISEENRLLFNKIIKEASLGMSTEAKNNIVINCR